MARRRRNHDNGYSDEDSGHDDESSDADSDHDDAGSVDDDKPDGDSDHADAYSHCDHAYDDKGENDFTDDMPPTTTAPAAGRHAASIVRAVRGLSGGGWRPGSGACGAWRGGVSWRLADARCVDVGRGLPRAGSTAVGPSARSTSKVLMLERQGGRLGAPSQTLQDYRKEAVGIPRGIAGAAGQLVSVQSGARAAPEWRLSGAESERCKRKGRKHAHSILGSLGLWIPRTGRERRTSRSKRGIDVGLGSRRVRSWWAGARPMTQFEYACSIFAHCPLGQLCDHSLFHFVWV